LSGEEGVPLASRRIPLDPDALFLWSMAHPYWATLDAMGEARVALDEPLLNDLPVTAEISTAAIVMDPLAPYGVRTISNRVILPRPDDLK
jgi:hypothetical protein